MYLSITSKRKRNGKEGGIDIYDFPSRKKARAAVFRLPRARRSLWRNGFFLLLLLFYFNRKKEDETRNWREDKTSTTVSGR